jgi:hypothetical protein
MASNLNELRSSQLHHIMRLAVATRRAELVDYLWKTGAGTVQAGPFQGMKLSNRTSWGDGDMGVKILGCYEQELWPHFKAAFARPYRTVVNVGCAEGYYAVGSARAMPQAHVHALDVSPLAQDVCRAAAALNGVGERVTTGGAATPSVLAGLLSGPGPRLLVMDCEGAEETLLDPVQVPQLASCDFIVECHDFAKAGITAELRRRLAPTHQLTDVFEGPRDPNTYAPLRVMQSIDRWILVCENRPCTMNWLVGRALNSQA